MIKDTIAANEAITPNGREMEVLKENFPACFHADGSFDIERFKEFLSDKVSVVHEGYELRFLGKNYARLLSSLDTTTVIVPDEEHNTKPENKNSENINISGDNLDLRSKPWRCSLSTISLHTAPMRKAKSRI